MVTSDYPFKDRYNVDDLRRLISFLRSEKGCQWDHEQTHESIRRNFIEEAYEACEAIDEKDTEHLKEELGDVLTQVVFHADIEADAGNFDLDDVADGVCKKLIFRHPHVFGNVTAADTKEILNNWDDIKRIEKNQPTVYSAMESVSKTLPSLWRSEKVQKKAAKAGADISPDQLELQLSGALAAFLNRRDESSLGTLLFYVTAAARQSDIDPEYALTSACEKFMELFKAAEESGSVLEGGIYSSFTDKS